MKKGRTVLEAKRFGCYSCTPDTPLLDAVKRVVEEDISCLVVLDADGFLSGVITRTDMVRAYLAHDDWTTHTVGAHMTKDVVTVNADDRLSDVAQLLLDKHIHRVVVVRREDGQPRPVAVVSDADLVYHMAKEVEQASMTNDQ
jgi:CBS domain-containing protein